MIRTLLSANGWFAGLLVVMIVITVLFALILWMTLKPVKKEDYNSASATKKALERREGELTAALLELLNKESDEKKREELERKLREVKSAQKLVNELTAEEVKASKPAKAKPETNAPVRTEARPAVKPAPNGTAHAARPAPSGTAHAARPAPAAERKPAPSEPARTEAKPAARPAPSGTAPAARPVPAAEHKPAPSEPAPAKTEATLAESSPENKD